jgi:hypothetical protein
MVWGGGFEVEALVTAIPAGTQVLLGFNEPNFFAQANLSAAAAAELWPKLEAVADRRSLELASPAVNYCGGGCQETDPFKYLDEFFAACATCRVDYVAAHWYACDGPALRWYLDRLATYGRPIWLTEFACGDGADRSEAAQLKYMREAVGILESDERVARYAWFSGRTDAIPNANLLAASGELTALGQLYVELPSACGR